VALRRTGLTQPRDVRRQRRIQPWSLIPDCYELRCEGKVIGGLGADLWKIRAAALQYPRVLFAWRRLREGQLGLLGREERRP
jgi:hypothetical protein